jgi:hypothetical protein
MVSFAGVVAALKMFLAIGEVLAGVFLSERPNDSTIGVICCVFEVEASRCLTLAPGVQGSDPAAALAAWDFFFFWLFERGVEGTSAGVPMPADEGEGLATDPAGEVVGVVAAIFGPLAMTAALGVAGISISASERRDKVGDGGAIDFEIFVVAIIVLMKAGERCWGS